jgi:hypothetical protein
LNRNQIKAQDTWFSHRVAGGIINVRVGDTLIGRLRRLRKTRHINACVQSTDKWGHSTSLEEENEAVVELTVREATLWIYDIPLW